MVRNELELTVDTNPFLPPPQAELARVSPFKTKEIRQQSRCKRANEMESIWLGPVPGLCLCNAHDRDRALLNNLYQHFAQCEGQFQAAQSAL